MAPPKDTKTPLSPPEARQGVRGFPVLIVLIAAFILAVIIWVGLEIWGHHIDPNKPPATIFPQSSSTSSGSQGDEHAALAA
ncbi:cytoskeletal protein RodZ [Rhizobium sp. BK491]|nr:cytoskeletal protein RodZ [Rhizobium sp. BK491]